MVGEPEHFRTIADVIHVEFVYQGLRHAHDHKAAA
jgi:hypothetical protein